MMWNKRRRIIFGVLADADVRDDSNILYIVNDGGERCSVFFLWCGGLGEGEIEDIYIYI